MGKRIDLDNRMTITPNTSIDVSSSFAKASRQTATFVILLLSIFVIGDAVSIRPEARADRVESADGPIEGTPNVPARDLSDAEADGASAEATRPNELAGDKVPARVREVTRLTKDRVKLRFRYFRSESGKETIPVVLLHGWEGPLGAGSGRDLGPLAERLQAEGFAVAVPDMRGHGQSKLRETGSGDVAIDRSRFGPSDFRDMMLDVEAIRSFLVEENNAGRVNLNRLCLIGFEMGSVIALNWIHYDWMIPSFPSLKQGQDVKAFVLVSPEHSFRGFSARPALTNATIRKQLSAMVIFGRNADNSDAGRRLYKTLRRSRRLTDSQNTNSRNDDAPPTPFGLRLVELETRLAGSKLVGVPGIDLDDQIVRFIKSEIVGRRKEYPWRERVGP